MIHQTAEPGVAVTIAFTVVALLIVAWIGYYNFGPPARRRAQRGR